MHAYGVFYSRRPGLGPPGMNSEYYLVTLIYTSRDFQASVNVLVVGLQTSQNSSELRIETSPTEKSH